jgi:aspartate racemase
MKTLGLLGGMTYHATIQYYSQINAHVQSVLGGAHSASLLLQSFDHEEMSHLFFSNQWDLAAKKFSRAAQNLRNAGAEALILCVNTGHKVADAVEQESGLRVLHIIDFTGEAIQAKGLRKVALLGTKPVMEEDFIVGRLATKYGLDVIVPDEAYRKAIHDVIATDLGRKIVTPQTRELFLDVLQRMREEGAQGIVLACTELQFVVKQEDTELELFDTVELHARGAAEWMLSEERN